MKKELIGIFICTMLITTAYPVFGNVNNITIRNNNIKSCPNTNGDKWVKTFGGRQEEVCNSVMQTNDGGYILVGETRSFGNGYSNLWLIKTDSSGDKLWDKVYGGDDHDYGKAVQQTSDGGYIITGVTSSFGLNPGYSNLWVIKTDSDGNLDWELFGSSGDDRGLDVKETNDGGYIVVGNGKDRKDPDYSDAYILKIDNSGNILWEKYYDFGSHDHAYSVEQTTDGGFIICVNTFSYMHQGYDIILMKTDSDGEKEWDKLFPVDTSARGHDVQQTSDGGYIITGYKYISDFDSDVWVIKTDAEGNKEWNSIFGEDGYDEGHSVFETNDGNYVVVGYQTRIAYYDVLLAKFDSDGEKIWKKLIGRFGPEAIYSGQQTSDNGFILGGYKFAGAKCDILLMKTDSEGDVPYNYGKNLFKFRFIDMFPVLQRILELIS